MRTSIARSLAVVVVCGSLTVPAVAVGDESPLRPTTRQLAEVSFGDVGGVPGHPARGRIPGTLLVKFRPDATAGPRPTPRVLAERAAKVTSRDTHALAGRWVAVAVKGRGDDERRALLADPAVAHVTADRFQYAQANDPAFRRYQGYLRETMDFPQAWDRESGAGVTIAVIDTGVDGSHPDLGRVLRGHDFVDNDRSANDPNGHGTFSAGIVAAIRDNRRGIAGASRATILPVRVLNTRGFGRDSDVAEGIRWAVRHHADVVNLSLGSARPSRISRDAVRYAERQGVVVIASSGNYGSTRKIYPAAYPTVVAVGATDDRDRLTWFSQRGDWVDLVAPGWRIASTVPNNRYGLASGTSFSAPLVTGATALVVDAHPHWAPSKVRSLLLRSAADAGAVGPDPYTGFGVVDVDGALGGKVSVWAATATGGRAEVPTVARTLDRRVDGTLNPEGASPWFVYQSNITKDVTIEAKFSRSEQGVLRGDVVLDVYDADLQLIRRVDRWRGSRTERTTIKTGATFYARLSNDQPTRGPGGFVVKTTSGPARVNPTVGDGPQPMVLDASPQPNATQVNPSDDLLITLGRALLASSINAARLRLIDGSTGEPVARNASYDEVSQKLTIDPAASLQSHRDYVLVLESLRSESGAFLPETWIGFRTS